MRAPTGRPAKAGFTIIELAIASGIFTVIGYALMSGILMGNTSQTIVLEGSTTNRDMRRSSASLGGELEMAQASSISLTTLKNGNHQLEFMVSYKDPAGALKWGASDKLLGNNENWKLRYTVLDDADGERLLVRQVVDDAGKICRSTEVARGLETNNAKSAGFWVQKTGDLWEVKLSTGHTASGVDGEEVTFHVKAKN